MNQSDNVSRFNQNADGTTSNSLTADAHQRLRLAAHILANGAIRAALKQQANRQQKDDACQGKKACNPVANNSH
jgi:hypothetical protein